MHDFNSYVEPERRGSEFGDVLTSANLGQDLGQGQAGRIADTADGPYFRSFNYGEREISEDHPHHETYLELGVLRRLIVTVREELRAGALRVVGSGLTKVNNLHATVDEIADVTRCNTHRIAALPHLEKMRIKSSGEIPPTIHEGLDGLEEWAVRIERELEDAA